MWAAPLWNDHPEVDSGISVVTVSKLHNNYSQNKYLIGGAMNTPTVNSHFEGKAPTIRAIYDQLLIGIRAFGAVDEMPKNTSIHLENTTGFAGIYPRKNYITLHFSLNREIKDPRITKAEQVSARRFKHTVKLTGVADVNVQLLTWLREAYELAE